MGALMEGNPEDKQPNLNVENYIVEQVNMAVSRVEDDLTESLIDFLDEHLDTQINELVETKVIEKCLAINDNVSAVLNSRDEEEIVRKFCQKFMSKAKKNKT
jgi:hypothetical protein